MRWTLTTRSDPASRRIADRHYSRQTIGAPGFVPPGRCVVLHHPRALWVTSWPFTEFVRHEWAGAWICSCFRNEGAGLSSELISEAVSATRAVFGDPPDMGIVTFVDAARVRRKRDPGRCYLRAGWSRVGMTKGGLITLQLLPDAMPDPVPPIGYQESLFAAAIGMEDGR